MEQESSSSTDLSSESFIEEETSISEGTVAKNNLDKSFTPKKKKQKPLKKCRHCDKLFIDSSYFRAHEEAHINGYRFICACGHGAVTNWNLKLHQKSCKKAKIKKPKSYPCKECSKKYKSAKELNAHKKQDHAMSCEYCKTTIFGLKIHLDWHREHCKKNQGAKHISDSERELYACDNCETYFMWQENLLQHKALIHHAQPDAQNP